MKHSLLAAILWSLLSLSAYAQQEANTWYWGAGRAVQFLPSLQEITPGSAHQNFESCVSMSDRLTGSILFYSDYLSTGGDNNVTIRNMRHTVISAPPLRGYGTSSQGLLAVPPREGCPPQGVPCLAQGLLAIPPPAASPAQAPASRLAPARDASRLARGSLPAARRRQ